MSEVSEVYISRPLTDISLKWTNKEFIADQVFPVVLVDKETGLYAHFDKSNLRVEDSLRRGMAHSNIVEYHTTWDSYGPLIEHSLKIGIPQEVLDNYDSPLDPRTNSTNTVTEKIMIEKEKSIAGVLTNTSIVTQNVALSGTARWDAYTTSDPFNDIQTGLDTILKSGLAVPNQIVMGYQVWSKLKNHPALIDRVKYGSGTAPKQLKLQDIADLFEVERVLVGKAVENATAEGLADTSANNAFIWGKFFSMMYVNSGSNLESLTAGRTLTQKGQRKVYNWQDEEPGVGEWIKFSDKFEQKVIAADVMYTLLTVIS